MKSTCSIALTIGLESCLLQDGLQILRDDQWDTFKEDLLGALRNIGIMPSSRNIYGLKNGYFLCYWNRKPEKKNELFQKLLSRLRSEDTLFKMISNGISVIHVYTSVSLKIVKGHFRSSIMTARLEETFKSDRAPDSTLAMPEHLSGPSTVSPKLAISSFVPAKRRRSDSNESSVLERLNTQALLAEARNEAHQARQETELLTQERARLVADIQGLDEELRDLRSQQLTMYKALKEGEDEARKLNQGSQSRMEIKGHENKGREEEIIALETVIRDQQIALEISVPRSEVDQMKTRISQLEKAIADAETQQTALEDGLKGSLQAEKETSDRLLKSQEFLQAFQNEHALLKNKVAQTDEARWVTEQRLEEKEQEVEHLMKAFISFQREAEEVVSKERSLRESVEKKLDTVRQILG